MITDNNLLLFFVVSNKPINTEAKRLGWSNPACEQRKLWEFINLNTRNENWS